MMVAICEKAALFREGLATVVTSRGHDVVSCVSVLADALHAMERCNPDVMLLDVSLTDGDSLAQLGARRKRGPAVRVLLLVAPDADSLAAYAALEAGVADRVLDPAVALATLERAVNGQPTPAARPIRTVAQARCANALLTTREHQVIGLLLAGRSTDAIALALGVSRSTVHSHVQSILRKLGARGRTEAVSIYLGETAPRLGSVRWS
jgi:DNA-binding NarL/FixJ family response regulator